MLYSYTQWQIEGIAKNPIFCYNNQVHKHSMSPSSDRYTRLVSGFAATAFAALIALNTLQYRANELTAQVTGHSVVLQNYTYGLK